MPCASFGLTDPLLAVAAPRTAFGTKKFIPLLSTFVGLGCSVLYKLICARSAHWWHLTVQEPAVALVGQNMQLVGAEKTLQRTKSSQCIRLARRRPLMQLADAWRSTQSAIFWQFLFHATDVQSKQAGKTSLMRGMYPAFSRRYDTQDWAKQLVEEMRNAFMAKEGHVKTSTASEDARAFNSALSVWPLPPLDATALMRREELRDACAHAKIFAARSAVAVTVTREEAVAALEEGLALATHLPGASPQSIADMHADMLACVAFWSEVTGRHRATVQVKLMKKTQKNKKLHLDHVDARLLCALYGKGTEWVASPGVVHAAASFADHGGGGTLADILKGGLAIFCGALGAATEREVVLVRGTANPYLRRGQSRFHRSPDVNASNGEWRLLLKVDDGPGWWSDDSLSHLYRPSTSREEHRRRAPPKFVSSVR